MANLLADKAFILSINAPALNAARIIGTGGYLCPEEREELDWLTLVKWLGWDAEIVHPEDISSKDFNHSNVKWVIVTDVSGLETTLIDKIIEVVGSHQCLCIVTAKEQGSSFSTNLGFTKSKAKYRGKKIRWLGDDTQTVWKCSRVAELARLNFDSSAKVLATLADQPIMATKKIGVGKIAALSFHPSAARDISGSFTALLVHLLVRESLLPVAYFDWSNTVILRMDDPGSSETVHHEVFSNNKIKADEWKYIGEELEKRQGRLTVGYVTGWVDDGDSSKGLLEVAGEEVKRLPGKIYPSHQIKYKLSNEDNFPFIYDYEEEYHAIQKLRRKGLVEVEVHGYTHIHPDKNLWYNAEDKYTNRSWYREFGKLATNYIRSFNNFEHPLKSGLKAIKKIFQTNPVTLICPGDEFTEDVQEELLREGLTILSSYYTAVRIKKQLCWTQHVCAPYLDEANFSWFESGLPLIGYFHDFDISIYGKNWFTECLFEWEEAGARRFIDFREVSAILNISLCTSQRRDNQIKITASKENDIQLIRPIIINFWSPGKQTLTKLTWEPHLKCLTV